MWPGKLRSLQELDLAMAEDLDLEQLRHERREFVLNR
jgi:hypothetical protein